MLIFNANLGVAGAALATIASQLFAASSYIWLLLRRNMLTWRAMLRPPSREMLAKLATGASAVQLRALSLNIAFIAITRTTQRIDPTGIAAAAHAVVCSSI